MACKEETDIRSSFELSLQNSSTQMCGVVKRSSVRVGDDYILFPILFCFNVEHRHNL